MSQEKTQLSRRTFLKTLTAGVASGTIAPHLFGQRVRAATASSPAARRRQDLTGLILVSSELNKKPRLDLISLRDGRLLATFEDIYVAHAIVPVEASNRFFVHGRETRTGKGIIRGFEINLATEKWSTIYEKQLEGGLVLHWQPNPDYSLIEYNTIKDHAIHVLDTQTQ